jgi:short-subunit dehydrogenase
MSKIDDSSWCPTLLTPLNSRINEWQGKRIWLIGASSGIGAALASAFLHLGAQVVLSARRAAQLERIAATHTNALILPFDVQDEQAWASSHQQIQNSLGGLDLIIFCAAKYQPERSWDVRGSDAANTLQINLQSVYQGLANILPDMMQQGSGGIAIIASVAGYVGLPNASVYGPSKAALINLSELLYLDLHPKNINVYLVNPGFVKTELTAKNTFFMPALQSPEQAAVAIIKGMQQGQFEIHFPRRFTRVLKFLQILPYRWRFALFDRFLNQPGQA